MMPESTVHLISEDIHCDDCGAVLLVSSTDLHSYHGQSLCNTCFEGHWRECSFCGDLYDYDYEAGIRGVCLGDFCPDCSDEHFCCEECGIVYHNDDYGANGYCRDCVPAYPVREYHTGASLGINLLPAEGAEVYYGVELETDGYSNPGVTAEGVSELSNDEALFWLEQDCSLSNGFELITQPATLEYHRQQFPWREICRVLQAHGAEAETSAHAALHVHLSKSFFPPGDIASCSLKLIYLADKHRAELLETANTSDYLASRSARPHYSNPATIFERSAYKQTYSYLLDGDRYRAINICSRQPTLEARFFRSTLDPNKIIGAIELVDYLAHLARDLTVTQVKRLSWKRLVTLSRLNGYVALGGILCQEKVKKT